jgi:hypothetical protein
MSDELCDRLSRTTHVKDKGFRVFEAEASEHMSI